MFRFSSCCQCWSKIMTHSNTLKSCSLKIRIQADRYWHGNIHKSLFKQSLSQPATQWHVTSHSTLATSVACAACPSSVTCVWARAQQPCHTDLLGCHITLIRSQACFSPQDVAVQTLSLIAHLLSPSFQGFLWHASNFCTFRKNRNLSWEVLCKYPFPRWKMLENTHMHAVGHI